MEQREFRDDDGPTLVHHVEMTWVYRHSRVGLDLKKKFDKKKHINCSKIDLNSMI